jgi:hypothetical protein
MAYDLSAADSHSEQRVHSGTSSKEATCGTGARPSDGYPHSDGASVSGCRWHVAVGVSPAVGYALRRRTMP